MAAFVPARLSSSSDLQRRLRSVRRAISGIRRSLGSNGPGVAAGQRRTARAGRGTRSTVSLTPSAPTALFLSQSGGLVGLAPASSVGLCLRPLRPCAPWPWQRPRPSRLAAFGCRSAACGAASAAARLLGLALLCFRLGLAPLRPCGLPLLQPGAWPRLRACCAFSPGLAAASALRCASSSALRFSSAAAAPLPRPSRCASAALSRSNCSEA